MKREVMEAVQANFRPEFINRIDETVVYRRLGRDQIRKIVDIQLGGLQARLGRRGLTLEVGDDARDLLARIGFDPQFGARPLKRAIQRHLEDPLAQKVLAGEFPPGATIVASARDGEIALATARSAAA